MKFFLNLSITLLTLEPNAFADEGGSSRVYRGYPIKITDAPWMAFVNSKYVEDGVEWNGACGGSIIDEMFILTAGHCVYDDNEPSGIRNASEYDIRVGSADRGKGGHMYKVAEVHLHPKYDHPSKNHDVALLKLTKKIKLNEKSVKKIRLDSTKGNYEAGERVMTIGWGDNPEHPHTRQLYQVDLNVVSTAKCTKAWGGSVKEFEKHFICAYGPKRHDACSGDSGGPLVCGKDNIQIGTVSFGADCPQKHSKPGAYAKIADNLAWINSVMSEDSDKDDHSCEP